MSSKAPDNWATNDELAELEMACPRINESTALGAVVTLLIKEVRWHRHTEATYNTTAVGMAVDRGLMAAAIGVLEHPLIVDALAPPSSLGSPGSLWRRIIALREAVVAVGGAAC